MVRGEKKRIGASRSKHLNDTRSPVVEKVEPKSFFKAKVSCSQGRVDEWSVMGVSSSSLSTSQRQEIARSQEREERTHPEQSESASKTAAITFLKVGSERSPQAYNHLQQGSRERSEGGAFKAMNDQDRQTFLGPLEFPPLLLEPTLTEESDTDKAMEKESQEREAILGPIEFPAPSLESSSSEESDWVGRINSIVNPSNAARETIAKTNNSVLASDNVDWSNDPAVTPKSLPATNVEDKYNNPAGCTPLDVFNNMFSACSPVEHEPKVSTPKLPSWKYEHFLTAPDRKREANADPFDFSFLYFQGSTGSDLSYNNTDLDAYNNTDLDEGTMVTREAVTHQQTLQSTFTGTNLSETIVDDGSEYQAMDSLHLKMQRMSESVQRGLDNLVEKTMPASSSSPRNTTLVTPTTVDWSSRIDNLAEKTMSPSSSSPAPVTTSVTPTTADWSSRPDNLAEPQALDSLQLKIQRMSESVRQGLDNLAVKTMPTSSSPRNTTSVTPTTADWSSRLVNLAEKITPSTPITTSVTPTTDWSSHLEHLTEKIMPKSSSPPVTTSVTPTTDWSSQLEHFAENIIPKSCPPPITTSVTPTTDWSSHLENLAKKIMPKSSTPPVITSITPTTDWSSRLNNLKEKITPKSSAPPITTPVTSTTDWPSPASAAATTNRVHFVRSVGDAIRRRDLDASRLQIEIDRLRAKVESAKLKEQRELRPHQDTNRIRSALVSGGRAAEGAASAKTKTTTPTTTNNSSTLYLDQNSRSQSVMIRVRCDGLDE